MKRAVLSLGILAALACAQGPPGDPGPASAGVVRGVVSYDGVLGGPLVVGVFASFPPRGAPIAKSVIAEPRFPEAYEVRGVPPGRWFVLALIDTDPADGDRYRATRDAGGAYGDYASPWSLAVDASAGASGVDIDLLDPSELPTELRWTYR